MPGFSPSSGRKIGRVKNAPSVEALAETIRDLFEETLRPEAPLDLERPLMAEQGCDSLDMIEASFALEEHFGFAFSGRNPIEELDRRVGGGLILREGCLTPKGREILLERMPELACVALPETLRAADLPQYFNVLTYARLVKDFYDGTPDTCPETDEDVVLDGTAMVSATTRRPVEAPAGEALLEAWLDAKAEALEAP